MSQLRDSRRRRRVVAKLRERDGDNCQICGKPIDFTLTGTGSRRAPSLDHKVPRYAGGSSGQSNLRLAHIRCNVRRGTAGWPPAAERPPRRAVADMLSADGMLDVHDPESLP